MAIKKTIPPSCGLDIDTVQEHTECLAWLKNTATDMDSKISLMYTRLVTGNGEPSIPMQLCDLKHEITDVDQSVKAHVDWHKHNEQYNFKIVPILISILNIVVIIILGYLTLKKEL